MTELTGLPGHLRVERGLRDLSAGRESPEALLLRIAAPRLAALGLDVSPLADDANLALYARLRECAGPDEDAYAIYNAWLEELDSFIEALESRRRRQTPR
ncbi:MAG: hypothetical protein KC543_07200 [Myxococcales bacterium]|nr:hypothetical protein [Myxococcales bacterium]